MFFIFFGELCAPSSHPKLARLWQDYARRYVLFPWSTPTGVLVDRGGVDDLTLLDALLYPEVRFNVFFRLALVRLDKVLENVRVGVREDDACRLGGGGRVTTGVLQIRIQSI